MPMGRLALNRERVREGLPYIFSFDSFAVSKIIPIFANGVGNRPQKTLR